jgi:drug/metabolite transporter (DMT)-like permease
MTLDVSKRPERRHGHAIPLILLASLFMALMAVIVKLSGSRFTASEMVFWRNLLCLVFFFPWVLWSSPHTSLGQKLHTTQWKLHLTRGFTNFLAVYFFFIALKDIDLTTATVLLNTIPIFVPLIAFIWFRVKIHHRLWWAIGIAFLGIILVLKPSEGIFHYASIIALLSGIMGAITLVSLRVGHYSEPTLRMMFYLFVSNVIYSAIFSLFSFKANWSNLSLDDFKFLIPLGIFGLFYQICLMQNMHP